MLLVPRPPHFVYAVVIVTKTFTANGISGKARASEPEVEHSLSLLLMLIVFDCFALICFDVVP